MLDNVIIGRYIPIKSKIHSLNPLSKIICTVLFLIMCGFSNSIESSVCLLLLVFIMILNTNINIKIYLRIIKSITFLLLFILIIDLIVKVSIINILSMLATTISIVLYTSILTLTTPPTEITYGLERFFSPLKIFGIKVNRWALSISLALRFIPSIIDQGNKILKSQASRGIDYYNSNIVGKFLAIKALLIPMFILTVKKADMLADAMEVRLYSIDSKRINFRQNKWGPFDTYLVMIHILILIVLIFRSIYL